MKKKDELIFIIIAAFFVLYSAMVDVRVSFWMAFICLLTLAAYMYRQSKRKHSHR